MKTNEQWLGLIRMVKAFRKGGVTETQLNDEAIRLGFTLAEVDEVIRATA